jgi:hypothetical protein
VWKELRYLWLFHPGTVTPSPPGPLSRSQERGKKCRSGALNPEKGASAPLSQGLS